MQSTLVSLLNSDKALEEELNRGTGLTLLAFFKDEEKLERVILPVLDQLAEAFRGKVRTHVVDTRQAASSAEMFGLASLPAFVLLRDGDIVERSFGATPRHILQVMINKHL